MEWFKLVVPKRLNRLDGLASWMGRVLEEVAAFGASILGLFGWVCVRVVVGASNVFMRRW